MTESADIGDANAATEGVTTDGESAANESGGKFKPTGARARVENWRKHTSTGQALDLQYVFTIVHWRNCADAQVYAGAARGCCPAPWRQPQMLLAASLRWPRNDLDTLLGSKQADVRTQNPLVCCVDLAESFRSFGSFPLAATCE